MTLIDKYLRTVSYSILISGLAAPSMLYAAAPDLPADAANLTEGTYLVSATTPDTIQRTGEIGISGEAVVSVSTDVDGSNTVLENDGNVNIGDGGYLSLMNHVTNTGSNVRLILQNHDLTVNEGGTLELNSEVDAGAEVNAENVVVNGGTVKVENGSILGTITVNSGELSVKNGKIVNISQKTDMNTSDMNISDAKIGLDTGILRSENHTGVDGTSQMTINNSNITMDNQSVIEKRNSGSLNISNSTIVMNKDAVDPAKFAAIVHNAKEGDMNFGMTTIEMDGYSQILKGAYELDVDDNLVVENNTYKTDVAALAGASGAINFNNVNLTMADNAMINNQTTDGIASFSMGSLNMSGSVAVHAETINMQDQNIIMAENSVIGSGGTVHTKEMNLTGGMLNASGDSSLSADDITIDKTAVVLQDTAEIQGQTITVQNAAIDLNANSNISTNEGSFSNSTVLLKDSSKITATSDLGINNSTLQASGNSVVTAKDFTLNNTLLKLFDGASISAETIDYSNNNIVLSDTSKITTTDAAGFTISSSGLQLNDTASVTTSNLSLDKGTIVLNDGAKIDSATITADDAVINMNGTSSLTGVLTMGGTSGSLLVGGNNEIGGRLTLNNNSNMVLQDNAKLKLGGLAANGNSKIDLGLGQVDLQNNGASFASGSTVAIRVEDADAGTYGKVVNSGNVDVSNGSQLSISIKRGAVGDTPTDLSIFDGTVTGNFDTVGNNLFEIVHKNDGIYTVSKISDTGKLVEKFDGTKNNAGTAQAWFDGGNFAVGSEADKMANTLFDVAQLDGNQFVDALTALAPTDAPQLQSLSTENALQIFNAVDTRLQGGSSLNLNRGRDGRYVNGMSSGDIYREDAIWVQGLYNKSELDDTKKSKGFDAESYGGAIGIDNYVHDYLKLGLGYAYTTSDIDGFLRKTDVDTHSGFVYGEFKPNNWYINAIASYGLSSYSENKSVLGNMVKADYDVNTFAGQVMTGYKFGIVTPEIGMRYVNMEQDDYTDSVGQKVQGTSSDVMTGVVGIMFRHDFFPTRGFNLRPELRLAATYDISQDGDETVVTTANGASYKVEGEPLDKFGVEVGTGVNIDIRNGFEMALKYEGKFRKDYTDHTGLASMKVKF